MVFSNELEQCDFNNPRWRPKSQILTCLPLFSVATKHYINTELKFVYACLKKRENMKNLKNVFFFDMKSHLFGYGCYQTMWLSLIKCTRTVITHAKSEVNRVNCVENRV